MKLSIGRLRQAGAVIALAAALAGCHRKPAGQVVATVDGGEITRRDLVAEMQAAGGRSDADLKALQSRLVSAIVDRRLLVEEAQREKLDKSPDFLSAEQRQREILLASMLAQTLTMRAKAPDAAATQAFIASNPQMFGQRKLLLANEVSAAAAGIKDSDLASLNGGPQIVAYLKAHKLPFSQRNATLDTLTLPADLSARLQRLPAGQTLAIRNGGVIVFTTVLNTRDAPVPADQQAKVATALLRRQRAAEQIQSEIKDLRGAANIQYLPGFAPDPATTPKG